MLFRSAVGACKVYACAWKPYHAGGAQRPLALDKGAFAHRAKARSGNVCKEAEHFLIRNEELGIRR